MSFSKETTEELKEIVKEECDKELTDQEALEASNNLVGFFDLLLKIDRRNKKNRSIKEAQSNQNDVVKEPLTKERLEGILKSKKLEQLIGYAENHFFDAKKGFYNLDNIENKHEFCKDITAFANNNGGYLIIGCDTDKPETRFVEFVKSADGIVEFPNIDRAISILKEYVYPNNIGTIVNFENITINSDKKFLLIKIVENSEGGPYFVRRHANDREYIAYYVRTNDSGIRLHLEYLHELVRQGVYFEKYLKNISGTTEKILSNTEKIIGKTAKTISLGTRYDIKKYL